MTWADVFAVLPVVLSQPDRAASAERIERDLAEQCRGLVVLKANQSWSEQPQRDAPFGHIAHALRSVPGSACLYLEDDVQLAPDFGTQLERIIDEKLDVRARTAVSLFSEADAQPGYQAAPRPFIHAQGLIMPVWLAYEWGKALPRWAAMDRTQCHGFAPDICFGEVCDAHGVELLIHYPSLMQHLPIVSACGHTHYPSSPTFAPLEPTTHPEYPTDSGACIGQPRGNHGTT